MNLEKKVIYSSLIVSIGIALSGFFVAGGLVEMKKSERYVTVKGVSEREVEADLAFWPIRYVATGDNLSKVQDKIEKDTQLVKKFLIENGINEDEISVNRFDVTDLMAQQYRTSPVESNRFIVSQTLMVRTNSVYAANSASQKISSLVNKDIVLNNDMMPSSSVIYTFNKLDNHRLEMIAEATRNARKGAEQFAADSGSNVGAIRRANQGVFQILERDEMPGYEQNRQISKIIRVVSTIDFFLKN